MRKVMIIMLALCAPTMAMAQWNWSASSSPTSYVTGALLEQSSDQYLDPISFIKITDPVFLLKLKLGAWDTDNTLTVSETLETSPGEAGFGAWMGPFFGAAYYGFDSYSVGNLGTNKRNELNQNDTLIISADGYTVLGKTSTISNKIDYSDYSLVNPIALFGMKIGTLSLGVKASHYANMNVQYGTFTPLVVGYAATATAKTATVKPSGAITYLDSSEYGLGFKHNDVTDTRIKVGANLPLGFLNIHATAEAFLGTRGLDTSCSVEDMLRVAEAYFTAYTPPVALPGKTATSISDIQTYDFTQIDEKSGYGLTGLWLSGVAEIPLQLFSNPAIIKAGLAYQPTIQLYSAQIKDNTGAALNTGNGISTREISYTSGNVASNGFRPTTIIDIAGYSADKYLSAMSHGVSVPLSLVFTPSDQFRFGFGTTPSAYFRNVSREHSGKTTTTKTYDDNDGVVASNDTEGYVDVTVTTDQQYTETTAATAFNVDFDSFIEFNVMPAVKVRFGAATTSNMLACTVTSRQYSRYESSVTTRTVAGVSNVTAATVTAPATDETATKTTDTVSYENGGGITSLATFITYKAGLSITVNPNLTLDFVVRNPNAFNLTSTSVEGGFFNLANYSIQATLKLPPNAK